jgi:CRISPR/Cas system CSM-associated protein Csm2 small subunit
MALYKSIEELLEGSESNWKESVSQLMTQSASVLAENLVGYKLSNVSADTIVKYGQVIGFKCSKSGLKYSQLRRYVDEIKTIGQAVDKFNKIKLFRIHLLHGYSRQKEELEPFYRFFDGLIKLNKIQDEEDFDVFIHFIDSVTAHYEAFRTDSAN